MATWDLTRTRHHVLICNGGSCMKQGGEEVTQAIRTELARLEADSFIHTTRTRCNGRCTDACVVIVYPEGTWYKNVTPESGAALVRNYIVGDEPLSEQISHRYSGHLQSFVRMNDAVAGVRKVKP